MIYLIFDSGCCKFVRCDYSNIIFCNCYLRCVIGDFVFANAIIRTIFTISFLLTFPLYLFVMQVVGQGESQTEQYLRDIFDKALQCIPCLLLLRNLEALEKSAQHDPLKEPRSIMSTVVKSCLSKLSNLEFPFVLVATCEQADQISPPLRSCFRYELQIDLPDEKQRSNILTRLTTNVPIAFDVSISELALLTASLSLGDLRKVMLYVGMQAMNRIAKFAMTSNEEDAKLLTKVGCALCWSDFEKAINDFKADMSETSIKASPLEKKILLFFFTKKNIFCDRYPK